MSLIALGCQCEPDCPPIGATQGQPGNTGQQGIQGIQGAAGVNSFSNLAGPFTVPAAGASNNATVDVTAWMASGQSVYIPGLGYFVVTSLPASPTVVSLTNPGYATNAAAGATLSIGTISPAGVQGAAAAPYVLPTPITIPMGGTGQITPLPAFNALSPLAVKGDLLGFDGTNNVKCGVGTDGLFLIANSTTNTGFGWGAVTFPAPPTFDQLSPAHLKGDLIVSNAADNVSFPVGPDGYVLTANGTSSTGLAWEAVPIPLYYGFVHTLVTTGSMSLDGSEGILAVNRGTNPGPTTIILAALSNYESNYVMIKDELGDAATNNITIIASDGSRIQGSSTYTISTNFGHVFLYSDGTQFQLF